jgi:superfamily II DNA or RNA helicase
MILRYYQKRDLAEIWALFQQGCRRVCYVLPTAGGKTITFVSLVAWLAAKDCRVVIVVHRQELVDQTCEALAAVGLTVGIIASGHDENPDAPVQVAMAQTLVRRLDRLKDVSFLVVDEAHHALADTWRTILNAAPQAYLLGCTATPERLDGAGLAAVFDKLVGKSTVREGIENKWLSKFVIYVPERLVDLSGTRTVAGDYVASELAARMGSGRVLADVRDEFRRRFEERTAIAFCPTIAHSQFTAAELCSGGVRARHVDGDTPSSERRALIAALETGEVQVLCNCSLISEGLNVPSVGGIIDLRPTKSLARFIQQVGRALRPADGKDRAIILDYAGNVFRHGPPDLDRGWSLAGRPKKPGKALVRRCPECGAVIPISAHWCPECNADLRPGQIKPVTVADPVVELDPALAQQRWLATGPFKHVIAWAGKDEMRLREIAAARNYKPGWVYHRLKPSRHELSP